MSMRLFQITSTIAALGLICAVTAAILFFMRLPIFDAVSLSWTFVFGLLNAAIATAALIVRNIWEVQQ